MDSIVFIVDTRIKLIEYAGPMPSSYGNIPGLDGLSKETLSDLSWAQHPGMAILDEAAVRAIPGMRMEVVDSHILNVWDYKWSVLEADRSMLIEKHRWRVDRYTDEKLLGREPTEDIRPVLDYIQAIREIKITNPDPFHVQWPVEP